MKWALLAVLVCFSIGRVMGSTYLDQMPNSDNFLSLNPYFGSSGGTLYLMLQTPIAEFLPSEFLSTIVHYVGFSTTPDVIPLSSLTIVTYCGLPEFVSSSNLASISCATAAPSSAHPFTFVILATSTESAPGTLKLVTSLPTVLSSLSVPSTTNLYILFGKDRQPNSIVDDIKDNQTAAAVIIVVILILLLMLGCCIFLCYRRFKQKEEQQAQMEQQQGNRNREGGGAAPQRPSSTRQQRVLQTVVEGNRRFQYQSNREGMAASSRNSVTSSNPSYSASNRPAGSDALTSRDLSDVQVAVVPRPGDTTTQLVPVAGSALSQRMRTNTSTAQQPSSSTPTAAVPVTQPAPSAVAAVAPVATVTAQSRSLFDDHSAAAASAGSADGGAEAQPSASSSPPPQQQMVQLDLLGY